MHFVSCFKQIDGLGLKNIKYRVNCFKNKYTLRTKEREIIGGTSWMFFLAFLIYLQMIKRMKPLSIDLY